MVGTLITGQGVQPLWQDSLAAPQKVEYRVTTPHSESRPQYLPKRSENMSTQNLHGDVHGSIIHKHQNMESTQTPISE